ncbi:MAG: DUF3078 domain-containing protein, partial [Bacteroidota bacterium]
MKKPVAVAILAMAISIHILAQDPTVRDFQMVAFKELKPLEKDGWKKAGTFIISVNQGALRNWVAGGETNTLGISSIINYNINHKKGKYTWNNYFDLAFGFQNASSFGRFRKTDDRIDITSKYGYQFSQKWYAALLLNINTQALRGFEYGDSVNTKISNFFTP